MRISLTDLVDVISKSGSPKATKVAQIKARPEYRPALDLYKQFRDDVIAIHKGDKPKSALADILSRVTEKSRLSNYPAVIAGYKKWWGNKSLQWFQPPSALFSRHGVDVAINPELGLLINGRPHVIKFYLKAEKLSKARADLVTSLMRATLAGNVDDATFAILDVRNSKLYISGDQDSALLSMVDAELAYVATLWGHLQ